MPRDDLGEKASPKLRSQPRGRLPAGHYCATRLPEELHKALKLYAISVDRALGAVVIEALVEYLAARGKIA
jgi:hypothetical protein